jgi:tetratricopeptide (TPR) repeat protein
LAALALLAFVVYANSLSNGFVGDDKDQLIGNALVSSHRVAAAFGSGVWAFRGVQGNYYRPLQFVVYIVLHGLFGYEAAPFHLLMILLHVGNTLLVYLLSMRLTGRARIAVAAGALFAIHPIHTEAVDWIASLPDLMLTGIVTAAVWWFARHDAAPRGLRIAGHGALYLAALLTKETGVMLLPLYVAFELVFLRRPLRDLRRNAALYASMAAALAIYLAMRWSALGGLAPAQQTFHHLTPVEFASSAVVTAAQYVGTLVLPLGLNYFHVFHATGGITIALLLSAAVLAIVAVLAIRRTTPPAISYGILWIALALAPALNLTGVGQNVFAERYLCLPSVGYAWVAAIAWDWWAARQASLAWAAGLAILCAGAWQTMARNQDWRDDFTLLQVTLAQSPEAGILHNNMAGAYIDRNDPERALYEERLAVKYEPRSAPFHKNLGLILMARDPRAALAEFEEALRLQPNDAQLRGLLEQVRAARK